MNRRPLPLLVFVLLCVVVAFSWRRAPAPGPAGNHSSTQPSHVEREAPPPADEPGELGAALTRLSVQTQPPGASLMLNGKLAGCTPLLVDALPLGAYGVRLEKEGCQPVVFRVDLGRDGAELVRKLEPLPAGVLVVDIKPAGADVLLDGELAGQTPLKLNRVPVGAYDLQIRKTNFNTYAARVEIAAGETRTYSGFELTDRVMGMLEGLVRAEPQHISHYIDLAHYYFVNNELDKAVDTYAKGFELTQAPLNFDGPGYPGRERMSEGEISQEERMRHKDQERLLKEIEKHKSWPGKDCRDFRRKIEEAIELAAIKNPSWEWAEHSAEVHIGNGNFDRAERIYTDYIAAVGQKAPASSAALPAKGDAPPAAMEIPNADKSAAGDAYKAYAALIDLHLRSHDLDKAGAVFDTFYKLNASNAVALRFCSDTLLKKPMERLANPADKTRVLEMIKKTLTRAAELTYDKEQKAQCQADLGMTLMKLNQPAAAVEQYESALAGTEDRALQEDRSLGLAGALSKSGRNAEAKAVCEKLLDSQNKKIRLRAEVELRTIQNAQRK